MGLDSSSPIDPTSAGNQTSDDGVPVCGNDLASARVADLMRRLQTDPGDRVGVFGELQRRYAKRLDQVMRSVGVLDSHSREDLSQEVWLKLWQMSRKQPGQKGGWDQSRAGNQADPLQGLLSVMAEHMAFDLLRRRRRHFRDRGDHVAAVSGFGPDAPELGRGSVKPVEGPQPRGPRRLAVDAPSRVELQRLTATIAETVERLPAKRRSVIERKVAGRTNAEVSRELSRSPGQISKDVEAVQRFVVAELRGRGGESGEGNGPAGSPARLPRRPRSLQPTLADGGAQPEGDSADGDRRSHVAI
jgi:DNA-directed RNA polymerase specialized sigma24 family protein